MWVSDEQTRRFLAVNEAAVKLYGWSREEFLRLTLKDILPPEEVPGLMPELNRPRGSRRAFVGQCRHWTKGRAVLDVEVSLRRIPFQGRDALLTMVQNITQRKQAEEAWRRSMERLKRAEEIGHLGSWELDLLSNRLTWSDEVYRIFGLRPQQFAATYAAFLARVHPEDRAAVDAAYSDSLRAGRSTYEIEHRIVRSRTGEVRTVIEKCEHFRDAAGRIVRSVGMVHDVTDRKRAEEVLRESEAQVRLALSAARAASWTWDFETNQTTWSPEYYPLYGYKSKVAPTFKNWLRRVHPADRKAVQGLVQRTINNRRKEFVFEFRIRHPDRGERWIANQGSVIYSAQGKAIGATGINLDITDRKQAEAALRESEQRYRTVADFTYDWEFWTSPAGRFIYVSPSCERITGYKPHEFLADPGLTRRLVHPDDRLQFDAHQRASLTHHQPGECEWRIVRPDGTCRWVAHACLPVFDAQGQYLGARGSNRDITERKQAESMLKEITATLEQRVAERTADLRHTNRTLRMLTECNEVLVRATDEVGLLQAICRLMVEVGGYRMAWVGFAEQDEAKSVRPAAQAGFEAGYLDMVKITWADNERGRGPTGIAIRTGQPVIARDILTHPAFGPWRQAALERGYAASATLPLKTGEQTLGALMVYAAEPGTFDSDEVELLAQLAGDLAYGISALRTRAEHRRAELARREAHQRLMKSEAQFRLIMDNLADLVAVLDLEGHRLYNSPSYRGILGDPDQLRGTSSFAEVHPEDRPRVEQAFRETVRTGVGRRLEYRMNDQRGGVRYIESQGSVIRDDQGGVAKVVVVSRDVTARKQVEDELHRLSAHLLEVHDLERRRLARELHDTTAQHLAALSLNLGNLRRTLGPSAASAQALCGECLELAHQAAQEIRTQSYLLHPPLLEVMGLAGAIEDYAQGFSARSGMAVDLELPDDFGRLPEDMELALFRVVQESLANVLKHSGNRRAIIRLTRQDALVTLAVQDMGHGIPADKLARLKAMSGGSGVGLGGMQERLRLLGGRLDLDSGPSGTTLTATVPLAGAVAPAPART